MPRSLSLFYGPHWPEKKFSWWTARTLFRYCYRNMIFLDTCTTRCRSCEHFFEISLWFCKQYLSTKPILWYRRVISLSLTSLIPAVRVCVFTAPSQRTVDERSETSWKRSAWIFQQVDVRRRPSLCLHRSSKVSNIFLLCLYWTFSFVVVHLRAVAG